MRRATVSIVTGLVLLGGTTPARADVWTGSCTLTVTFNFSSRVEGALALPWVTTPSYSISVGPAVDLNPLTGTWEPCVISLDALDPFSTTSVSASGSSNIWTCTSTLASGSWSQSWPSSAPSVVGSHLITGGPEGWTMTMHNWPTMNFVGTMDLTVHPSDALSLAQCETRGLSSLTMIGEMEFQDP